MGKVGEEVLVSIVHLMVPTTGNSGRVYIQVRVSMMMPAYIRFQQDIGLDAIMVATDGKGCDIHLTQCAHGGGVPPGHT